MSRSSRRWFLNLLSASVGVSAASLLASAAGAQPWNWERQSPLPTSSDFYGVASNGQSGVVAVGNAEALFASTNSGATWNRIREGEYPLSPIYSVAWGDANTAYAFGPSSFKSVNGGRNWSPLAVNVGNPYSAFFFSATHGVVVDDGVAVTTDGGQTWSYRSPGLQEFASDFFDMNRGVISGRDWLSDEVGVYRTLDGGVTMQRVFDTPGDSILWLDANTLLLNVGADFYLSTDAGTTWNLWGFLGFDDWIDDMSLAGPGIVMGLSASGAVYRSFDSGLSWQRVLEPVTPGAFPIFGWGLDFSDPTRGYVVGPAGEIMASDDLGVTWTQLSGGTGNEVFDIDMLPDGLHGIAVTGREVLTTTDGTTWNNWRHSYIPQFFFNVGDFTGGDIIDPSTFVVCAETGELYRSDDAGLSWYPLIPPEADAQLIEVDFTSLLHGVAIAWGGTSDIWVTNDGGFTWLPKGRAFSQAFDVHFTDDLHGWVLREGQIARTLDGGNTWQNVTLPAGGLSKDQIHFADANHGWVVGWQYAARTSNGGLSWAKYNALPSRGFFDRWADVRVVSQQEVHILGTGSVGFGGPYIISTLDGGATWTTSNIPTRRSWDYYGMMTSAGTGGIWVSGSAIVFNGARPNPCRPDMTGSSDPQDPAYGTPDGNIDLSDFFYYLDQFAAGNTNAADLTGSSDPNDPAYGVPDGAIDLADFFVYLDLFVQGC